MYFDTRRHVGRWIVLAVLAVVLILAAKIFLVDRPARQVREEAAGAIAETIRARARQCFAVEGVYPESLDYLIENYGLRINTTDYYVVYEAFADNLPPDIRVAKKEG